jgi:hypothetical protein
MVLTQWCNYMGIPSQHLPDNQSTYRLELASGKVTNGPIQSSPHIAYLLVLGNSMKEKRKPINTYLAA